MKIVHEDIENIIYLNKECFYSLIIEDKTYYRKFIENIIKQINEKEDYLFLYDNNKLLDFSKEVIFIESCLKLDIEERKLSNYIQKDLIKNLNDNYKNNFNDLINKINDYLKEVTLEYDISLKFEENLSINDFFKSFEIKADLEEEDFVLRFINKIKSLRLLLNTNIFIFNNLHSYFTIKEIEQIKEETNKLEIYFLNISSFKDEICSNEKVILIDKDLCEITINI